MCRGAFATSLAKAATVLLCALGSLCYGQAPAPVLTQGYDLARDGLNGSETLLTLSNVNTGTFGKLFSLPVDGYVYGQPLYVPNVTIPGNGTHNVVYLATMNDSLYAYDADGLTLQPLWKDSLSALGCPSGWACIPVPPSDNYIGNGAGSPAVGVLSTPVIDATTNTIYVVAKTQEILGSTTNYFYRLHALDITTGLERTGSPVIIQGQVPGNGSPNNGSDLVFSPQYSMQRPGLALVNNVVYISFGSAGDDSTWHGWVFGYSETPLAQVAVFSVTPNGTEGHGGIWMHGAGLAADSSGYLYFSTGNGAFDGATDFGDSVLRLATPGLTISDYFTPWNQQDLDAIDSDIASGGVTLLPASAGTTQYPNIALTCGKNGTVYVLDRDSMGHFNSTGDTQIIQELANAVGGTYTTATSTTVVANCFSTAAYWQGNAYFAGIKDPLKMFTFSGGLLSATPASESPTSYPYPGATPVVSASGSSNGVVWAIENAAGTSILHAYNATNVSDELYNSGQVSSDAAGPYVNFAVPTVANGKVYVDTQTAVAVYGLFSELTQAAAPSFSPAGGTFSGPVAVTITEATAGTTVYYTTDGSTPTTSSMVYTVPVAISGTVTLNALAAGGGYRSSSITTAKYVTGSGSGSSIAFMQGNFATPQSTQPTVTATYSQAQAAGDLNLVVVGWYGTTGAIPSGGVTDSKGNVYTLAVGPFQVSGIGTQAIYYAKNIAAAGAGANVVTVTFSTAAAYPDLRILEYAGANASSPIDTENSASGNSANTSVSITTQNANELIVAGNYVLTTTTGAGTGFTSRMITVPNSDIVEDASAPTAGAYTATAPVTPSGGWIMQAVALKAAATGAAPPTISSLSPASGIAAGGTPVTITGTNFSAPATVTFGSSAATNVVVVSGTSITATTPAGAAGVVNVTVTCNGRSGTLTNGFSYLGAPTVSSVAPNTGPLAGGTSVTITGTNFAAPATVTFGSTAATSVVVVSTTSITAITPAGALGAVNVTVTSNGQNATLANGFTYASVQPASFTFVQAVQGPGCPSTNTCKATIAGVTAGHLLVVDAWSGIKLGSTLNGVSCTDGTHSYATTSSTPITFATPTDYGNLALSYLLSAPGGSSTITCTWTETGSAGWVYSELNVLEFAYTGKLAYDKDAATTFPSNTGTSPFTTPCVTPANSGSLLVGGWITNIGGHAGANSPWTTVTATDSEAYILSSASGSTCASFNDTTSPDSGGAAMASFYAVASGTAPTITAISPNVGPLAGGTPVTITGTNFAAPATVTFGGAAATNVTVVNSNSITATTPAGAAGPVNVTVTSNGQSGTLSNGFTYSGGLTVSSVSPNGGPRSGGTLVTITGANFTAPATVTIGKNTATNVTVVNSTSITATTPAGAAGTVNVTVTCNGQSGTLTGGFTYAAPPAITSVTPNTGSTSGGTAVTIIGANFAAGATVSFGSTAATNVVVGSATSITAISPAHAAGAVTVTVSSNGMSGSLASGFTYTSSAAIGFAQVASATPQTPTQTVPVAFPAAQVAGDLNIVVVGWADLVATVQSVSDSAGNHYSLAIGPTQGTGMQQSIYYASNIAAGGNSVTVTFSQAAAYPDIRILEYHGVSTLDVTASGVGTTSPSKTAAAKTTAANELIFGANYVSTGTHGPGNGFTARIITVPNSDIAEDEVSTAAGSFLASAPLKSAGPWVMQMASFK